jgi:pre-mRNA-splicing helicase BRR2
LPQKLPDAAKFSDPHTKALVLLQAHFSRHPLSAELASDQAAVLGHSLKLLQALVDVISSNGWLKPAIVAMECSQMIVQGLWDKDHPLLQLPHVDKATLGRCQAANNARLPQDGSGDVETVFDVMALDDEVRDDLLRLSAGETRDVAAFCNAYPNVELSFEVVDADQVETGDAVTVVVTLEREADDDGDDAAGAAAAAVVYAPKYPKVKHEGWWLVVGNAKTNALLCVKRVALNRKATVKLDFVAPDEPGDYALTLYFMCDSYIGCDQEYALELKVAQGDSDEDEDEGGGEEKDLEEEEASGDEGKGMKD